MSITNNAFSSNSLTNTCASIYASNISLNILYCLHSSTNTFYFVKKAIYKTFLSAVIFILCINSSLASNSRSKAEFTKELRAEYKILHDKTQESIIQNKISKTDIVIGSRDAKVILIEYFAPTCTHCSEYHLKVFPELKRKYIDTGKIAYVMRECVGNKQDFDASLLARCKGDTESYKTLTSHLLHTQDVWAYSKDYRANLYKIANDHGISNAQYDLCLNDESKSKTLFDHAKLLASDFDFIGTPSFYINGKLFKAEYSQGELSDAIEDELTKEERR